MEGIDCADHVVAATGGGVHLLQPFVNLRGLLKIEIGGCFFTRRAERLHFGEVFLEIAIVLSSLAILTKRKLWYIAGSVSAVGGLILAATAFVGV